MEATFKRVYDVIDIDLVTRDLQIISEPCTLKAFAANVVNKSLKEDTADHTQKFLATTLIKCLNETIANPAYHMQPETIASATDILSTLRRLESDAKSALKVTFVELFLGGNAFNLMRLAS